MSWRALWWSQPCLPTTQDLWAAHGAVKRLEPSGELIPRGAPKGLQGRAWFIHGEGLAVPAVGAPARPHGRMLCSFAGEWGCGHWSRGLPDLQVLGLQLVDLREQRGVRNGGGSRQHPPPPGRPGRPPSPPGCSPHLPLQPPELITQAAVDLHELLHLCLGGSQGLLQLQVLLQRHGPVGQV